MSHPHFTGGETKAGETGLPWVSAGAGPEASFLLSKGAALCRAPDAGEQKRSGWLAGLEEVHLSSPGLSFGLLLGRPGPVVSLVNIQPLALSSLEWNVKPQMGEQSAP